MKNRESQVRDALVRSIPDPPAATDRADRARAYAQQARRTRMIVIGGVFTVVLAALLIVPFVVLTSWSDPTPSDRRSPVGVPYQGPFVCPTPGTTPVGSRGFDQVPSDAESVRICLAEPQTAPTWSVPDDALTTGVDAFTTLVNALPAATPNAECDGVVQQGYSLTFQYSDESVRTVVEDAYGCHDLRRGDAVVRGGDDVLSRFAQDLLEQRRGQPAPPVKTPQCPNPSDPPRESVLADEQPPAFAAALVCTSSGPQAGDQFSAVELKTINQDLTTNSHAREKFGKADQSPCVDPDGRSLSLVGVNAWGDHLRVFSACSRNLESWFWFLHRGLDRDSTRGWTTYYWVPSDQARSILAAHLK